MNPFQAFRHGTNKFDKETEKFYISIRTKVPTEIREDIKEKYFSDTKDKYLPEPLKNILDNEETIYWNLKSLYEIPIFKAGEGNSKYSFDDVIEMGGGLPPYGSVVKLSMRLKESAIYPLALQIIEVVKVSADDYFN